jgi:hypothetical protein
MAKKKLTKAEKKTADDLWEYAKQANMQSDNIEMGAMSSDGIQNTGDFTYSFADLDDDLGLATNTGGVVKTATVDSVDSEFSFNYNDVGLDVFDEMELQDKYPALKQAHEHYKSVLEICKTKEKEENED